MVALLLLLACSDPSGVPLGDVAGEDTQVAPDTDTGADSDSGGDSDSDTHVVIPPEPPFPVDWSYDGDGDGSITSTRGGDDCDDADATVYPGAPEDCGGVDRDCDGVLWEGCGEVWPDSDPWVHLVFEKRAIALPVHDLTGDGQPDLYLAGPSKAGVVVGGELGRGGSMGEEAHTWSEFDGRFEYNMFDGGDVDGDGWNDLVVIDPLDIDAVAVVYGPVPTDGKDSGLVESAEIWEPPSEYNNWGKTVTGGWDLDGDGRRDVLTYGGADVDGGGQNRVELYFPRGRGVPPDSSFFDTERWSAQLNPRMVEDLDGDGFDDLLVKVNDAGVQWFSGPDLTHNDGALIEDLASGEFDGDGSGHVAAVSLDWYNVGDWNGDGAADVVGVDSAWSEDPEGHGICHGRISHYGSVLPGYNEAGGYITSDQGSAPPDPCTYGTPWLLSDADAGGILCKRHGDDRIYGTQDSLVIFPAQVPVGLVEYSDAPHFEFMANTSTGVQLDVPLGGPDVTGDGLGDVAFQGDDGVYLLPGIELPWEDPAAWE